MVLTAGCEEECALHLYIQCRSFKQGIAYVSLDYKRKRMRMELGENLQTVFCHIIARNLLCGECCLGIQWQDFTVARRDPFVGSIFVRFVSSRLQSDLTSTESIRLRCRHGHGPRTEAKYLLSRTRIELVRSV